MSIFWQTDNRYAIGLRPHLFAAIQNRQIDIVELLLQKRASITKKNSKWKEPLEYAIHMGCGKNR